MKMGSGASNNKPQVIKTKVKMMGHLNKHVVDHEKRRVSLFDFMRKQKAANSGVDIEQLQTNRLRRVSVLTKEMKLSECDTNIRDLLDKSTEYLMDTQQFCYFCEKYTGFNGYACRVCPRSFHYHCMKTSGVVREGITDIVDRTKTAIGWSCHLCDNISLLLTDAEMRELTEDFEKVDLNKDAGVNLEEYLDYRTTTSVHGLTDEEIAKEKIRFKLMDLDGNEVVDWWEFLNAESAEVLARRSKDDLVTMLKCKEIAKCRSVFQGFDEDGDGSITEMEARRAYMKWYEVINDRFPVASRKRSSQTFDTQFQIAAQQSKLLVQDCGDTLGVVTLEEFVKNQALYYISARPNTGDLSRSDTTSAAV